MILVAAMKIESEDFPGGVLIVPCRRHGDGFQIIYALSGKKYPAKDIVQGFIDTRGKFYNRIEAAEHALDCGQLTASTKELKHQNGEDELFSEDLY